jgi:hypothetical protein
MVKLRRHVGLLVILSMVSVSFGNVDEPKLLVVVTGTPATPVETNYYYHHDRQFNVMAMTNSVGVVQERYTYTAAGKSDIYDAAGTTLRTASICGNPYMFTSRRWDAKTGNYYFRARFQRPSLAGQFLNRDPLEYPDG